MYGLEASGFAEFDRMAVLFRRTRDLVNLLATPGRIPDGGEELIAHETLPHVEDIEQGFRVSLRASAAEIADLRALVSRAGVGAGEPANVAEKRAALIEA